MDERHENEQYFFDVGTLAHLRRFVAGYESPCCVCAPSLGRALAEAGVPVRVLDIDERFSSVPGFRRWDLSRPEYLDEAFDLILCDPPFFNVSLSRLFAALRTLSRNDFRQKLLVSYLCRRADALTGTFAQFGLEATGYRPGHETVEPVERNAIEFFGNLDAEETRRLRGEI